MLTSATNRQFFVKKVLKHCKERLYGRAPIKWMDYMLEWLLCGLVSNNKLYTGVQSTALLKSLEESIPLLGN